MGPWAWRDVPISKNREVERGERDREVERGERDREVERGERDREVERGERDREVERGEWDGAAPTAPPLPPTEYHVPLRDESLSSSPSRPSPPTSPSQVTAVTAEPWPTYLDEGRGRQPGHRVANGRGGGVGVPPFPTAPTPPVRGEDSLYPPVMTGRGTSDREEEQQERQQQGRQRRWQDEEDEEVSTRPPSATPPAGNWGNEVSRGGGRKTPIDGHGDGSVPYYLPVGSSSGGSERAREGGRKGKHKARVSEGTSVTEDDWNSPDPLLAADSSAKSRPQEIRGRGGSSVERGPRSAGGGGEGGGEGGGGGRGGKREGGGSATPSSSKTDGRESPSDGTEQGYSRGVFDGSSSSAPRRRKAKGDPGCCRSCAWLVPTIVIACCAVFVLSMYRNNCPQDGGAKENKCVLPFLGRFSFEPLKTNPMIGPSATTLENFGALDTDLLRKRQTNKYRLFSYAWLHAGVVHLVLNMLGVLVIGLRLEQEFGPCKTLLVYLVSAFGGSLMSALLLAGGRPVVGASGALFGLLGATLAELIINWTIYGRRMSTLLTLVFLIVVNLLVGLTPIVDNFSHIGGFVSGLLLGFALLVKPQFGYLSDHELEVNMKKYSGYKDDAVYPVSPLPMMLPTPPPKRKSKHNHFQRTIRCMAFALLLFGLASATTFVLLNVDGNKTCSWCKYMNCVNTRFWDCNQQQMKTINCTGKPEEGIVTCLDGRTYPIAVNASQKDMEKTCVKKCM